MNITDEEIRIKVAEAMGLEIIHDPRGPIDTRPSPYSIKRKLFYTPAAAGVRRKSWPKASTVPIIPNYPEDLNACHEMEKSLVTVGEWISYMENLASTATIPTNGATAWELVCKMSHSDQKGVLYGLAGFVHATARQRCIAYLKTKGILP